MEKNGNWNGCWNYFKLDEKTSRINEMKINQLKKLLIEFGDSVYFEHDLKKKKIGLI